MCIFLGADMTEIADHPHMRVLTAALVPDRAEFRPPVFTYNESAVLLALLAAGGAFVSRRALAVAHGRSMDAALDGLTVKLNEHLPGRAMVIGFPGRGFVLVGRGDILSALFEAASTRLAQGIAGDRLRDREDAVAARMMPTETAGTA